MGLGLNRATGGCLRHTDNSSPSVGIRLGRVGGLILAVACRAEQLARGASPAASSPRRQQSHHRRRRAPLPVWPRMGRPALLTQRYVSFFPARCLSCDPLISLLMLALPPAHLHLPHYGLSTAILLLFDGLWDVSCRRGNCPCYACRHLLVVHGPFPTSRSHPYVDMQLCTAPRALQRRRWNVP